ncbi:hypothetical protein [uncultured Erythrobacter sp.]|uniref:hypothetical protein n=1 Tax=uncultured Erythrobacter sp. TaxID=263913 RepID=UPI00260CEFB9|nr:hypothetical protein [uncultured Erythrobacter sp.]
MIRRRIFAAILLYGFAVGSALFWNRGEFDWLTFGVNIVAASLGLIVLHFRWRIKERRAFTPKRAKDVFS